MLRVKGLLLALVSATLLMAQAPTGTISGTVSLTGCVNLAQPITFEFRPVDGTPIFKQTVILGADGSFQLNDLGSRNGTYVRIRGERELAHGDYLFIGQQLLRVEQTA